jgi:hypothetical protein
MTDIQEAVMQAGDLDKVDSDIEVGELRSWNPEAQPLDTQQLLDDLDLIDDQERHDKELEG